MAALPYVVSCDIGLLLGRWGKRDGWVIPPPAVEAFREHLNTALSQVFSNVVLLPEQVLCEGLRELVSNNLEQVISLDGCYWPSPRTLALTRYVDQEGQDHGSGPRYGCAPMKQQVARVVEQLQQAGHSEVILVDDVIFTGDQIAHIATDLNNRGLTVKAALSAVAINHGTNRLLQEGVPSCAVRQYDQVIDEVCERDFLPGAPQSGRTVYPFAEKDTGLPYLLPFGRPESWASIPSTATIEVSAACLDAAICLYQEVERHTGRHLHLADMPRLPTTGTIKRDERMVVYLQKCLQKLTTS